MALSKLMSRLMPTAAHSLISIKYIPQSSCAKIGLSLEPMGQLHPNLNWRLLLSIDFTTRSKLNFKGQKGPGFRPLRPCGGFLFLILHSVDIVIDFMIFLELAKVHRKFQARLGPWPYLAFMAFEIKIIFAVVNSMDKSSLQFKFGCN